MSLRPLRVIPTSPEVLSRVKESSHVACLPVPLSALGPEAQGPGQFDRSNRLGEMFESLQDIFLALVRICAKSWHDFVPLLFYEAVMGSRDSAAQQAQVRQDRQALLHGKEFLLDTEDDHALSDDAVAAIRAIHKKLGPWPHVTMSPDWSPHDAVQAVMAEESKQEAGSRHPSCPSMCRDAIAYRLWLVVPKSAFVNDFLAKVGSKFAKLLRKNSDAAIKNHPLLNDVDALFADEEEGGGGKDDKEDEDRVLDNAFVRELQEEEKKVAVVVASSQASRKRSRGGAGHRPRAATIAASSRSKYTHGEVTLQKYIEIVSDKNRWDANKIKADIRSVADIKSNLFPFAVFGVEFMNRFLGGACRHQTNRLAYLFDSSSLAEQALKGLEKNQDMKKDEFTFPPPALQFPASILDQHLFQVPLQEVEHFKLASFPRKGGGGNHMLMTRSKEAQVKKLLYMNADDDKNTDAFTKLIHDRTPVKSLAPSDALMLMIESSGGDEGRDRNQTMESFAENNRLFLDDLQQHHRNRMAKLRLRHPRWTNSQIENAVNPETHRIKMEFRQKALEEFERGIWCPGSTKVPLAVQQVIAQFSKWKDKAVLSPYAKCTKNLSLLNENLMQWFLEFDCIHQAFCPVYGVLMRLYNLTSSDGMGSVNHAIIYGPQDGGKSFIAALIAAMALPETARETGRETLSANTQSGRDGDRMVIYHEIPGQMVGLNANGKVSRGDSAPNSAEVNKFKSLLSEHKMRVEECAYGPDGKRMTVSNLSLLYQNYLAITNVDIAFIAKPIVNRMTALNSEWFKLNCTDEERRKLMDLVSRPKNPELEPLVRCFTEQFRGLQFLTILAWKLIECHILPRPALFNTGTLMNKIINNTQVAVLPNADQHRANKRVLGVATILTLENAILEHFTTPLGPTYRKRDPVGNWEPKPFEMVDMLGLIPRLSDRDIGVLVFSLGITASEFENPMIPALKQAIVDRYFPEWRKASVVLQKPKPKQKPAQQLPDIGRLGLKDMDPERKQEQKEDKENQQDPDICRFYAMDSGHDIFKTTSGLRADMTEDQQQQHIQNELKARQDQKAFVARVSQSRRAMLKNATFLPDKSNSDLATHVRVPLDKAGSANKEGKVSQWSLLSCMSKDCARHLKTTFTMPAIRKCLDDLVEMRLGKEPILQMVGSDLFISLDFLLTPRASILLSNAREVLEYNATKPCTVLWPTYTHSMPRLVEILPDAKKELIISGAPDRATNNLSMLSAMVPAADRDRMASLVADNASKRISISLDEMAYAQHLRTQNIPLEEARKAFCFPSFETQQILFSQWRQAQHVFEQRKQLVPKDQITLFKECPVETGEYPACLKVQAAATAESQDQDPTNLSLQARAAVVVDISEELDGYLVKRARTDDPLARSERKYPISPSPPERRQYAHHEEDEYGADSPRKRARSHERETTEELEFTPHYDCLTNDCD